MQQTGKSIRGPFLGPVNHTSIRRECGRKLCRKGKSPIVSSSSPTAMSELKGKRRASVLDEDDDELYDLRPRTSRRPRGSSWQPTRVHDLPEPPTEDQKLAEQVLSPRLRRFVGVTR
jgi:hypothetical protein